MSFNHLSGRHELRGALTRELESGQVSHATLFTGPAGSGKKSWALALARSLLCREPAAGQACMQCPSCRTFAAGNNPYLAILEPDGKKIKIGQLRDLKPFLQLQGVKRVCLIRDAASMTPPAANKLLVTLEEPPTGLYFILLAELPDTLLSTVFSRCRHYRLMPLGAGDIENILTAETELDARDRSLITALSSGLPGLALERGRDERFKARLQEARQFAGALALGKKSFASLLLDAETLSSREDLVEFLSLLGLLFRDLLILKAGGAGGRLLDKEWLPEKHAIRSTEGLEEAVIILNGALKNLALTNVNRRLMLESTFVLIQRRLAPCL